jgi:hypothetical protein
MSDLVRVSISDLAVRGALISVLRPLIYSLNPSGDIISGNQNAAYVRLQQVTRPIISQGRVRLQSV